MENSRRDFLKKVAYSAPVIVSLGALTKPEDADACIKPSCLSFCDDKFDNFKDRHENFIRQIREDRSRIVSFIKTHRRNP